MKSLLSLLLVIIFGTIVGSEKNNQLTFLVTNKTNLNFYVHTCDVDELRSGRGPIDSGTTYRYQRMLSRDELLKYKNFQFLTEDLKPWKKWFDIKHYPTGQSIVVEILFAYFNSKQALKVVLHNLKEDSHTIEIRNDPNNDSLFNPFNITVHLILKRDTTEDFLPPNSQHGGFRKMDLEGSTLEITEVHTLNNLLKK